jgi:hypothetical protein
MLVLKELKEHKVLNQIKVAPTALPAPQAPKVLKDLLV